MLALSSLRQGTASCSWVILGLSELFQKTKCAVLMCTHSTVGPPFGAQLFQSDAVTLFIKHQQNLPGNSKRRLRSGFTGKLMPTGWIKPTSTYGFFWT